MIFESIKMVFKVFKTNKLRTFLTMLGIIIGIFSITIIFAISSATKKSMLSQFENFDFSEIQVQIYGTFMEDGVVINIPESEIYDLEKEDCIKAVYQKKRYPFKELEKKMQKEQNDDTIMMQSSSCIGINYNLLEDLELVEGRKFTKMDEMQRMPFCIIQTSLAQKVLGKSTNILGETIKINDCEFKIIGRFDEEKNSFLEECVYVLNSYAKDYFVTENNYDALNFTIKPISQDRREEAVEVVRERLLEYMSSNEFYVSSDMGSYQQEIDTIMGIIELVFGGIAGLSLVVGGIGIMNIMLVSVNERIKEIGIRMALGANSGNIMLQFLIEGVMLTLLSGIIGIILATGAIYGANIFISNTEFAESGFKLGVDLIVMAKTVVFCGVVGVIFGLYPAKKAANLNPIDALRYE